VGQSSSIDSIFVAEPHTGSHGANTGPDVARKARIAPTGYSKPGGWAERRANPAAWTKVAIRQTRMASPSPLFCAAGLPELCDWRLSAEQGDSAAKGGAPRTNPNAARFLHSLAAPQCREDAYIASGIGADCGWQMQRIIFLFYSHDAENNLLIFFKIKQLWS